MGTTDISLAEIFNQLLRGNVGLAISAIEVYLSAWPNPQTKEKLDTLKQEYQLMTGYWEHGMDDPQRKELYQRLLQRVYMLSANISIHRHLTGSSYLQTLYTQVRQSAYIWSMDTIRQEMESFVSDIAMLDLDAEEIRKEKSRALYQQHQKFMNALFNYILTSRVWTDNIGQSMEQLLLSPTVDTIDQQLITSAIMLSLMNRFDIVKFSVLLHVYQQSQDEEVRQRALVGWVMGIDDDFLTIYPELYKMIRELLNSENVCQELTELQMQLVYSLNAERDTSTIQKEIWPDVMKNSSLQITRDGIKEEEDSLEDILHPDAAEQRMEKLEASMRRMADMQKQGSDIYFGGFSQMKRFPFFYDISNWFVPFFFQHPDVSQFLDKIEAKNFLEMLLQKGPFCDSDKYSFVVACHQVFSNLPANIKDMLNRNEIGDFGEIPFEDHTPTYIRRMYLMNLYRFFRLFPNRSALCNPFDTSKNELGMCLLFSSDLFTNTPLEKHKREIVGLLKKKHFDDTAKILLDSFPFEMHDVQYFMWKGQYHKVLSMEPTNKKALIAYARESYNHADYEEALDAYDRLMTLFEDNESYQLNKAICLIQLHEYEEAEQLLFQLNYKHPENNHVKRSLAWALTCDGKYQQADNLYVQLTSGKDAKADDFQNRGYCLWLQGNITEAAANFKQYVECEGITSFEDMFVEEELLKRAGISTIDIMMMEALVAS